MSKENINRGYPTCKDCFHWVACKKMLDAAGITVSEDYAPDANRCDDFVPAADVVEVKHGRWDSIQNPNWPAYSHDKCNLCGWWNTKNALCYDGKHKRGHSLNYCPNCGAIMDGECK